MAKRITKRKNYKVSTNSRFLAQATYHGDNIMDTTIRLTQYDVQSTTTREVAVNSDLRTLILPGKTNWFEVTGISDVTTVNRICMDFGLHSFDVKDIYSDQQMVKAVSYDHVSFILMPGFYYRDDENLDDFQIAFILGENFIISFQEVALATFDDVHTAIGEARVMIRQKKADYLLYILLRAVNTLYVNMTISIEDRMNDLQDKLLMQKNSPDIMHYLHRQRIEYTFMKRFIVSFREEYNNLLHNNNELIQPDNIVYFNNFDDKLRMAVGNLDTLQESLVALLDIYYNNNNLKMNEIMARLTVVSTIFIPLTFMAGVWGMNFDFMPEVKWKYGYLCAWGIFFIITALATYYLKKRKWF